MVCSPRDARGRDVRHQTGDHPQDPHRGKDGHPRRRTPSFEDPTDGGVCSLRCIYCRPSATKYGRRKFYFSVKSSFRLFLGVIRKKEWLVCALSSLTFDNWDLKYAACLLITTEVWASNYDLNPELLSLQISSFPVFIREAKCRSLLHLR